MALTSLLCPRSATRSRSRLAVLHGTLGQCQFNDGFDGRESLLHWLVGMARHMLRPSGRMFQMQYSVYGALCWAIADWKAAAPRWLDIASWQKCLLRSKFLGEQVIKQLLKDVGWAVG